MDEKSGTQAPGELRVELGAYAVSIPVPKTRWEWWQFIVRRLKSKAIGVLVTAALLTLFGFVNCMDVMLGFEATPSWLRYFAKGDADRVKIEGRTVHRLGPAVAHLPRGRSVMVLDVRSEVELTRRLDIVCDMTGIGGHIEGYVRKQIDPDDLPGGIPADHLIKVDIDFPETLSPYGPCRVIEAR